MLRLLKIIAVGLLLLLPATTRADDWPQWMGPKRDNVWREQGLLEKFPDGGPRVVWRTPIAGGYAGPAVANGRLFVTDYVTKDNVRIDNFDRNEFSGIERVLCLNAETGSELWRHEYPVKYTISYPAGPRCTPIVDGDKVYTLGAEGNLICFDAQKGTVVWQKDLPKEYGTKTAMWGYAGHPLIDGNKLICVAGGEGTHAVALDKNTGQEIWRTLTSPEQGYSPPTIIEAGGRRQLILARINALTSVDPETGREYWSVPYEATSGSVIMSPRPHRRTTSTSAATTTRACWSSSPPTHRPPKSSGATRRSTASRPSTCSRSSNDGIMYGFDQSGRLYAVELPGGKRLWETTAPSLGAPGLQRHGVHRQAWRQRRPLLAVQRARRAHHRQPDAPGLRGNRPLASLIEPTNHAFGRDVVWCMPAFANRRMYVRNDEECICVDLEKTQR